MSFINFKKILFCTSEDRVNCAKNLLKQEQTKKWLSANVTDERIICIIEFEKPSFISSIDVSNDGSAFIELLVSHSTSSKSDDWTVLLSTTTLMTPNESRSNINRNQIKTFKSDNLNKTCLNEKWTHLKIICEQKFNNTHKFGLNFVKLYSISNEDNQKKLLNKTLINYDDEDEDETEKEQNKIGSYFAKKQKEKKLKSTSNKDINVTNKSLKKQIENDNKIPENTMQDEIKNDKSQIMKNVVFVLSGFQNPLRSELRNKATSMGAIYNEDWDEKCTHLICAFANTPKFTQVQQTGKGFIVNKQWIIDCHKQNQLLSEKSYELKDVNDTETKNKDTPKKRSSTKKNTTETKEKSVVSKDSKRNTSVKRKSIATNEDEPNKKKFGELPDFFHDKHFYVSYGDYDDNTLLDITRVILAYDGILERQITSDVAYVITKRMWNQDFEKISKSNPDINFINLDWLQDCHDGNQFVPIQPYLIVP